MVNEIGLSVKHLVGANDLAVGGTPDDAVTHTLIITDANDKPTVTLTNIVPSLGEDADTSGATRVADIVVTDDGLGTNVLTLSGADASKFEIVGGQLRLRAGTALDFESDPSLSVVVRVDDASIAGSPDASVALAKLMIGTRMYALHAPVGGYGWLVRPTPR